MIGQFKYRSKRELTESVLMVAPRAYTKATCQEWAESACLKETVETLVRPLTYDIEVSYLDGSEPLGRSYAFTKKFEIPACK